MPIDRDGSPATDDDAEDADGCLCGMDHLDDDPTSDLELPAASGGVETDDEEQPGDDDPEKFARRHSKPLAPQTEVTQEHPAGEADPNAAEKSRRQQVRVHALANREERGAPR